MARRPLQALVREFHANFGAPIAERPTLITPERASLRARLIDEELGEYMAAADAGNLVEVADALGDLLYVVLGAAVEHGLELETIMREIHRSNMTKEGGPTRADGKILKGPKYQPPALAPLLEQLSRGEHPDQQNREESKGAVDRILRASSGASEEGVEAIVADELTALVETAKKTGWEAGLNALVFCFEQGIDQAVAAGRRPEDGMIRVLDAMGVAEKIRDHGPMAVKASAAAG